MTSTAHANALQQIRDAHAQLIDEGEVDLSFRRQSRGRSGGGFSAFADDPPGGFGPYTCRVAWQSGRPAQVGGDAGLQQRDPSYVLSMPEGMPMTPGDLDESMVRIETTHPVLGRFRLRNIKPMIAFGATIGWQSDLELIR